MIVPILTMLAAVVLAAALSWWPWRGQLETRLAWAGLAARFVAVLAAIALLLDPGIGVASPAGSPIILLDNSISMHSATANRDSVNGLVASLGAEVLSFGELSPGEPGGSSDLAESLTAAAASGRQVVVVTDGEVRDVGRIPADILALAHLEVIERNPGDDVAITTVELPERIAAGDSLHLHLTLQRSGDAADSSRVQLRDGARVLLAATARFAPGTRRTTLSLAGSLPSDLSGVRWLEVVRVGAPDAEPDNDRRMVRLVVTPSPGIVVLASLPDWDARALYQTLASVTSAPVRGYIQLRPGVWHRMDNLRPVPGDEVSRAARSADLLAVRGDTTAWRHAGRARLFWPAARNVGDWYPTAGGLSPLAAALAGTELDSLPPLPQVSAAPPGDWVALAVRQSRRGDPVPVVTGRSMGGRTVTISGSGFHRWNFQGGMAAETWRTLVATSASWLLAGNVEAADSIRPVSAVTQRGRAVRVRGAPDMAPVPASFRRDSVTMSDTLRFDAEGVAAVPLGVGRWDWQAASATGTVVVDPYSDELVPAPPTLTSREAAATPGPPRRSLRELLPFFVLAVAGFCAEWGVRRRLGLK